MDGVCLPPRRRVTLHKPGLGNRSGWTTVDAVQPALISAKRLAALNHLDFFMFFWPCPVLVSCSKPRCSPLFTVISLNFGAKSYFLKKLSE